jgi:hypothetical protein
MNHHYPISYTKKHHHYLLQVIIYKKKKAVIYYTMNYESSLSIAGDYSSSYITEEPLIALSYIYIICT